MNKTQCPHCFTIYVISDEQFRLSQGMVRCGTCRERFQAKLLTAEGSPEFNSDKAFIEPLSDEDETSDVREDFIPKASEIEFGVSSSDDVISDERDSIPDLSPDSESNSFTAAFYEFNHSLNSELSIEIADDALLEVNPQEFSRIEKAIQQELELPESASDLNRSDSKRSLSDQTVTNDEQLINEVDQLIENKLFSPPDNNAEPRKTLKIDKTKFKRQRKQQTKSRVDSFDELFTTKESRSSSLLRFLGGGCLALLALSLALALLYQLWLKQALPWAEQSVIQEALKPLQQKLDAMTVEIPIRRNLSQLELLSARTEAHPTRPSTVLLRVSLINRAEISQPLPWLELSLSDADGRLVSRRNLAPKDYIFNNRTDQLIGAKQLKKVTIELLAFPKQATGYELRLLNK